AEKTLEEIIDISMPASELLILIPWCQAFHNFSSFREKITYEKPNHGNEPVKMLLTLAKPLSGLSFRVATLAPGLADLTAITSMQRGNPTADHT
ncbi:MAG TPA: hypothetical protein VJQ48_15320, partial [Candidatus Binatia bacterium]|nr:hypothetical protein [Candidatus Binatia bacterium]